jgi:NAD(P)H-quinone oxidoreductase subunit 5
MQDTSGLILFDAFSCLMASSVLFLSLIITAFSYRYISHIKIFNFFLKNFFPLVLSLLMLVLSNDLFLFFFSWTSMGFFLSNLMKMKSFEKQADTESKKTPSAFLLSSALLAVTLGLLAWHTQAWTISSIQAKPLLMNSPWLWLIGALFCLTALVQSAFFPFHNWLLSSLSSPSPICAFIHAACAPMGVFLLLRFQWIFAADAYLQLLIFFIGGLSAFFFSLRRLVQSDIKHSLGYSTLSQIGFMIMSCGLGV